MTFNITFILTFFTVISVILILLGSVQLIKANSVPGSKLILAAVIGSILTIFIPEAESESGEVSLLIQSLEVGASSILMLMASYGFYRLASYTAQNSANKSAQGDA